MKLMKIETARLTIIPLNEQEMRKYILSDFSLEISLNLEHRPRTITNRVKATIETKILPDLIDNTKNTLYYTFWIVINKNKNIMVADICFKGEPNEKGEVEVGYSTYPEFQNKGFMTEAINGFTNRAFKQNNINSIFAATDPDNIASKRVLEKNNFVIDSQASDNIWWRLDNK
jgi:[ribosomal protein S5]-alanine N-acetyltransferase